MKNLASHIYAPRDAATNYQKWHQCRVTRRITVGTTMQCKECRGNPRERQRNKSYGNLCLIPLELRCMIYTYLTPPELPPPSEQHFSLKARQQLSAYWGARNNMSDRDWYFRNRKVRHTNPLNILAVSRAIHREFKNVPAYRYRMFNGIVSQLGFSLEGSRPEIDSSTNDPKKFSGKAKRLQDPFRYLHYIKPRRLQITCPFFVRLSEKGSTFSNMSLSTGLVSIGFDNVFNVLMNSPEMEIEDLRFRLLVHEQGRNELTSQSMSTLKIDSLDNRLISTFQKISSLPNAMNKNCTIQIACDRQIGRKNFWWLEGINVLIDGILKIAKAGDCSPGVYRRVMEECGLDPSPNNDFQCKGDIRMDLFTKLRDRRQKLALDTRLNVENGD